LYLAIHQKTGDACPHPKANKSQRKITKIKKKQVKHNKNVRTQMFVVGASIVHPVCTNESGQQERSTVRDAGWVRYIG